MASWTEPLKTEEKDPETAEKEPGTAEKDPETAEKDPETAEKDPETTALTATLLPEAPRSMSSLGSGQRPITREEKAKEVVCGCEKEDKDFPDRMVYLDSLEAELARSYYWSGIFLKDLFFFICNWHPFVGMFFSHPYHPWEKKDRILTFIVSCSITMLPAALRIRAGNASGLDKHLTSGAIFIFITLPVSLVEAAMYWLSVGDIFCKGWTCCVKVINSVKAGCLCSSLFVSAIFLFVSFRSLGNSDPVELVRPFLVSRLQSYLTWIPVWLLLPCVGFLWSWYMEKRSLEK